MSKLFEGKALFGKVGTDETFYIEPWNIISGSVRVKGDYPGIPYILDQNGGWELPQTNEQKNIANAKVSIIRRDTILKEWPIHKQLEAITEKDAGNPTKYNQLLEFLNNIKEANPKIL